MVLEQLPFADTIDFTRVVTGFIATRKDPLIRNADGSIAKDTMNRNILNEIILKKTLR